MPAPPSNQPAAASVIPKPFRWGCWFAAFVGAALVAAVYAVYTGLLTVPEHLNPWAPLDPTAAPGMLTAYKLAHARGDPARCLRALARTGMSYSLLPDRVTGPGCGFENAVLLRETSVRIGAPLSLSCPMALSFAMWEHHVLQPAAQQHAGQRVMAIDHLGSYACRNVNRGEAFVPPRSSTSCDSLPPEGAVLARGGPSPCTPVPPRSSTSCDSLPPEGAVLARGGPSPCTPVPNAPAGNRSRHATADALDIAGFTLASGKRITVLRQWRPEGVGTAVGQDALFLQQIHRGACRYFKGVLGPDYNAVHRDHFHFETGGYSTCR